MLGTRIEGGTVTLTCRNPATGKTEVIVGRAGRDRVFALADPQATPLPAAPVQAVAAGALVASRDPATGASGYGRVTATVSRPAPALVSLSLSDPKNGKAETLTCTPEHPLYVSGKGWVEAGDLGIGTQIVTRAGPPVVVKGVSWRRDETGRKPFTVYNLTVQGDHTYFAGTLDGGAWAHNSGGCPALRGDPYNPQAVEDRLLPPYEVNPKHDPGSGNYIPGADVLPSDAEEAYAQAEQTPIGTWWSKGQEGWYRYFSNNAGANHYSGTFPQNGVPAWIVRGW